MRPERLLLIVALPLLQSCAPLPPAPGPAPAAPGPQAEAPQTEPRPQPESVVLRAALAYYRASRGFSAAELVRERATPSGERGAPLQLLREAILLGHPRGKPDLARATALLETLMRSKHPSAVELFPLARLLADQYVERQRLENNAERLTQAVAEQQRRNDELQEKLNALTDIERSLPLRPARPVGERPAEREETR